MSELGVVAVHGIGVGNAETRKGFSEKLARQVFQNPTVRERMWHESVWEGENDKFDATVQKIIRKALDTDIFPPIFSCSGILNNILCCLFNLFRINNKVKITKALYDAADLIVDFVLYLDSEHGRKIRAKVRSDIEQALKIHKDGIVVVAHSLGSLIAHDVLHEMSEGGKAQGIKYLFTIGSPIVWAFDIRATEGKIEHVWKDIGEIKWFNRYYKQDMVAIDCDKIESAFGELDNRFLPLPDSVNTPTESYKAHCAYWEDERVAQIIKDMVIS